MSMVVRNNLSAVNTLNMLNRNHSALMKSLQTVATGMRINSAKDDASGYAISERMRVEIASLDQANRNTQNGMSMMKVAEGAVQSTVDILKTLKEKVINAANDTNTDADRAQIQKELDQSIDQINDNANVTYNGKYLVDGSKNGKSDGTFTALTNSSLDERTTAATGLVALKDRNGNSLNIQTGDSVTVSYVQQGRTYTTTFSVTNGTTLATIMLKAEAIDQNSDTFANSTNDSVVAVNGASSAAALITARTTARDNARTDRDNAQAAVGTAQSALTAAQIAEANFAPAKAQLENKFNTFKNYFDTNFSTLASNSYFGNAAHQSTASTDFTAWKNSGGTAAAYLQPCSNPSALTNLDIVGVLTDDYTNPIYASDPVAPIAAQLQTYYNDYVTEYNGFTTTYPSQSSVDALATNVANARTALTNAQNDLATKQRLLEQAQGALDAVAAPTILDGSKIGLDYSGQVISTPDQGSALTITAYNRGIEGQIAGFTISVTDTNGNIKKSVNAVLDAWTETIRAENASPEDNALVLQTGSRANQAIKIRLSDMRAQALGLQGKDGTTLNVSTQEKANAAINVLDNALQKALNQQTTIGAIESRLAYTSANLTTAIENLTASESTIRDADMAKAMTEYTKHNILMQASQAMLAQANQNNNQVLSLLR